ncbi:deoxyribonuclease-1-like [Watersipora subatra]|uniref:deoxyribonuclease-1-like n=1 Tax=Watersipora subatra TaxID=2589382 RepID=UPI00355C3350
MLSFLWISLLVISQTEALKIGAFNIQTLGRTKYGKEEVMVYIDLILRRYDIVLVQEIRDAAGNVIPGIRNRLASNGEEWEVVYSERLGRNSYKEQYAFYYRPDKITVESSYQYDDGVDDGTDAFSREPFGILVNSDITGGLKKFGILGVHIAPNEAVEELNALVDVFTAAKENWGVDDVMIMGDFNADCTYVSDEEKEQLDLRTDNSYLWLIGDDVDTTVSSTDCAYDRIVLTGDLLKAAAITSSAQEWRFDNVFNVNATMTKAVSDHYPVEVNIASDIFHLLPESNSTDGNTTDSGMSTTMELTSVTTTSILGSSISDPLTSSHTTTDRNSAVRSTGSVSWKLAVYFLLSNILAVSSL